MYSAMPTVKSETTLPEIIEEMTSHMAHRVIVLDSMGKAIGLISDSDLIARVHPKKHPSILAAFRHRNTNLFAEDTAEALMSPNPLSAPVNLSIIDAVRLMLQASRKWLVVVDAEDKPLGLVDRQALLLALSPDPPYFTV